MMETVEQALARLEAYQKWERTRYHRDVRRIEDVETTADGTSLNAQVTLSCNHIVTVAKLAPKARMNKRKCTHCERMSNGG